MKSTRFVLLVSCVLFWGVAPAGQLWSQETTQAAEPAASEVGAVEPVRQDIAGWVVHVHPELLPGGAHQAEGEQALQMLANHLQRVRIVVPPQRLSDLQQVELWIEHKHPRIKTMCYHPSEGWLRKNGHDPRLAKKVHIVQAGQLLSREQMLKHPAVILHELAHAFHDQVLGFDRPEIRSAFEAAKDSGRYDKVLDHRGKRVRHYGLTSPQEYFAEGTEALLYRNDFFPFVRAELETHDPILFRLLSQIWEPKPSKSSEPENSRTRLTGAD